MEAHLSCILGYFVPQLEDAATILCNAAYVVLFAYWW